VVLAALFGCAWSCARMSWMPSNFIWTIILDLVVLGLRYINMVLQDFTCNGYSDYHF
jgi:hypothetical protein